MENEDRKNEELRAAVEEGKRLRSEKGASLAATFMYQTGVPSSVIERVIYDPAGGQVGRDSPSVRITMADVLLTHELATRVSDYAPPAGALASLEVGNLSAVIGRLRDILQVDAVGVSLFAPSTEELTWIEIAGELRKYQGRRFPRRHSMCDVCFQTAQSQLFVRPHRYFKWMAHNGIFISEALITPLRGRSTLFIGTLWATTQNPRPVVLGAAHLAQLRLHAAEVARMIEPIAGCSE